MKLYAAIDLHSNNGVLSVLDEDDLVLFERRLPNELPMVLDALAPYRDQLVAGGFRVSCGPGDLTSGLSLGVDSGPFPDDASR